MPTRNWREIGFHGRYKFYHSLENAPGFINVGLRLFNYPLYANSFMQLLVFCNDTMRVAYNALYPK